MHNVRDTVQQSMYMRLLHTHTHWTTKFTNQNMIVYILLTTVADIHVCIHSIHYYLHDSMYIHEDVSTL